MSDPQHELFADLLGRLLDENIENSPAFRALARRLAHLTLERLEAFEDAQAPQPEAQPDQETEEPQPPARVEPTEVVPLRIGDARVEIPVAGATHAVAAARDAARENRTQDDHEEDYLQQTAEARAIDLERITTRCRLKATACLHQIVRQNQERDTADELESRQQMNDLIAQAKAIPDCFLWMFFRKGATSTDEQLELISQCYKAMAEAANLCRAIEPIDEWHDEAQVREALQYLATTSSGLRVSLADTWLTQPDIDQDQVHRWLKLVTAEHRYHVRRHMQLNDPADPRTDVDEARQGAQRVLAAITADQERAAQADRLLKRGLYHGQRIRDAAMSPYEEEPPTHDCKKVNGVVEALIDLAPAGLDAMIREIATLAEPSFFSQAVTPHERLVSAAEAPSTNGARDRGRRDRDNATRERVWSDDVGRVRRLINGGQIVVIGGEPRRDAIERMTDAFELDDVVWPALSEHGPAEPMRAPIANPQTRLVVVLIKLTGHEHAERAREFARQASVPYVLMPAGYNPEQIAAEVLRQASGQLHSA